jgi:hypothetical protein
MVHAFSDEQRKYAVRLLAADVGKVERELTAANQRIKRLEEAGDAAILKLVMGVEHDALEIWNEAKEAKP